MWNMIVYDTGHIRDNVVAVPNSKGLAGIFGAIAYLVLRYVFIS